MSTITETDAQDSSFVTEEMRAAALADAVKRAVISTFTMICGAAPTYTGSPEKQPSGDGVVGIISFVGDLSWCLMLALPAETTRLLTKAFAGFEIPIESDDMNDVIGELTNVLAGAANGELEAISIKSQMSLPIVARGSHMALVLPGRLPAQRMSFYAAQGPFCVTVIMGHLH